MPEASRDGAAGKRRAPARRGHLHLLHRPARHAGARRDHSGVADIGFAIFGLAPTGGSFMVGVPVMALWGLSNPAAQGLMSRHVAPSEQGRLQGANASVQGIASLVGPGLFSLTFAYFIAAERAVPLPGAPFVLAAVLLAAAPAVAVATTRGGAVGRG
jgi:MFS transporter, DHA1 family, tetracycline resistance protein